MSLSIDYSLTAKAREYLWMLRFLRCWDCGHPLAEEPGPKGTMLTCLPTGRKTGHEGGSITYELDQPSCGKRWWVDED
jgi:hypothetical protein